MMACQFCQIAAGERPVHKVYEDKKFLAFLDRRALTKGNALVIPKKHYQWVDEVPEFGQYFEVAKKIGLAAKKALGADWISYFTIGHEIPHAHIRVIPRYANDLHGPVPDLSQVEDFSEKEMETIASLLTKEVKYTESFLELNI